MKQSYFKIFFTLFVSILFVSLLNAQVTTGMAIQGIARDASNNAITNTTIGLKFTLHYTNSSSQNVDLAPSTATVTTDAFGVFSCIANLPTDDVSLYNDFVIKLKIEQTSPTNSTISDENLNYVPYAISASNGVPTGTIMPYVGTVAPRGWALCDGGLLPTSANTLKALLGTNYAPDLRGMFLRGAGTNSNGSYANNVGPALKAVQTDVIKSHTSAIPDHNHDITDPGHSHTWNYGEEGDDSGSGGSYNEFTKRPGSNTNAIHSSTTGITINNKSLTATYTGGTETRPINYGVTYIIKL